MRFIKNNDDAFGSVYLSSYLPLKYPTHFQSLRSDYYSKRKQIMIYETDPQFCAYVFVEDTLKCIIGKFHRKMKSMIILAGI